MPPSAKTQVWYQHKKNSCATSSDLIKQLFQELLLSAASSNFSLLAFHHRPGTNAKELSSGRFMSAPPTILDRTCHDGLLNFRVPG